tara:strand:+ start:139 stop:405 length:267 start_codon:yes stop_codon:yes gene_type:complete
MVVGEAEQGASIEDARQVTDGYLSSAQKLRASDPTTSIYSFTEALFNFCGEVLACGLFELGESGQTGQKDDDQQPEERSEPSALQSTL